MDLNIIEHPSLSENIFERILHIQNIFAVKVDLFGCVINKKMHGLKTLTASLNLPMSGFWKANIMIAS